MAESRRRSPQNSVSAQSPRRPSAAAPLIRLEVAAFEACIQPRLEVQTDCRDPRRDEWEAKIQPALNRVEPERIAKMTGLSVPPMPQPANVAVERRFGTLTSRRALLKENRPRPRPAFVKSVVKTSPASLPETPGRAARGYMMSYDYGAANSMLSHAHFACICHLPLKKTEEIE
jgi:hypothetical protein